MDRMLALHTGSQGFDIHLGHMSERFFRSSRPGYPHPVRSELENGGIRVAVGDCSVTERRRWHPPYKNRQNCACARKTLQTQRGRMHGTGCVWQWFRTAEPLGERRYGNWNTHSVSFCLLNLSCQQLQSANKIVITVNSGPLIGWQNFHTFTCTGNFTMCWEPDLPAEKSCL